MINLKLQGDIKTIRITEIKFCDVTRCSMFNWCQRFGERPASIFSVKETTSFTLKKRETCFSATLESI
jgi:hypothetical protein